MGFEVLFDGQNFQRLLSGLWVTIEISFTAVALSALIGLAVGIAMLSRWRALRWTCQAYLEVVRVMPLLVLLFISYFGIAKWWGIHLSSIQVAIIVFTFWGAAEMGDLVRGALSSIERHHIEAGQSLGLNAWQIFIYVLLPLGLKRMTPGVINLFTRMIKTSSLAMLIGAFDVIKIGQQIIENALLTQPSASFWVYGFIFLLYFVICYPLSYLSRYLENLWKV